jgi:lysophospholipase L1-like esterase
MRWLVLIALLVASNVTTFYVTKKNARPKGHSVESVLAEVRLATGIVIAGDSLVEDAKFPASLCGLQIVNAGIGGAGASTLLAIADKMQTKPALIVVSIGVNDAEDPAFAAKYSLLLDTLPRTQIAVVTLAQSGFERINQAIKAVASKKGAHLIDLGSIKDFKTRDGIHPIDPSYAEWRERILDGARQALDCDL